MDSVFTPLDAFHGRQSFFTSGLSDRFVVLEEEELREHLELPPPDTDTRIGPTKPKDERKEKKLRATPATSTGRRSTAADAGKRLASVATPRSTAICTGRPT